MSELIVLIGLCSCLLIIFIFTFSLFYIRRLNKKRTVIEIESNSTARVTHDIFPQISLSEILLACQIKRSHCQFSSDSSSESEDIEQTNTIRSMELFRIEFLYKLHYEINRNQLQFEIIRLIPMQYLIDQCFSSIQCKIRLIFNHNENENKRKFLSKINPIHELFTFEFDQRYLRQAYLKIHFLANHHRSHKRIEIGQTVLVIHQHNSHEQQYSKFIQIYEERIDMIVREQVTNENKARALICLVYEQDRCLLHVGVIKILGIQYLLKQIAHHRDQIQIKISTNTNEKRKSKLFAIANRTSTFSTSFHVDFNSLQTLSLSIVISYRRSLISPTTKAISMIEFDLLKKSHQQWIDTLTIPNRPHVHWHNLEPIE